MRSCVVVAMLVSGVAGVISAACGQAYDGTDPPGGSPAPGQPGACRCGEPGCTCATIPPGWLAVAVTSRQSATSATNTDAAATTVDAGIPSCPAYFTDPRRLLINPHTTGATCPCTCGTANGCLHGSVNVAFGSAPAAPVACNGERRAFLADGECHPSSGLPPDTVAGATNPRPAQDIACPASATLPPIVGDDVLTVCTSPAPTPCAEGLCVQTPEGLPVCVTREGEQECPAGWPARTVVTPEPTLVDRRKCAACTCTSNTSRCGDERLVFFGDAQCKTTGAQLAADAKCALCSLAPSPSPTATLPRRTPRRAPRRRRTSPSREAPMGVGSTRGKTPSAASESTRRVQRSAARKGRIGSTTRDARRDRRGGLPSPLAIRCELQR